MKNHSDNLIDFLRTAISDGTAGIADVPSLIIKIISDNLWQERYVERIKKTVCFVNFEEFVATPPPEGLGSSFKVLYKLCTDEPTAIELLSQRQQTHGRGGDRRSKDFKSDNVTFEKPERGNSSAYALRRLRNERPDLYHRVLNKELKINRAMTEAGLRRKSITVSADVNKVAKIIKQQFKDSQIEELINLLQQ